MRKILGFNLFLYLMVVLLFSGCVYSYATQEVMKKEKVILIHGFGRSKVAMWPLYIELYSAGYDVSNIGYSSFNSNIDEIKKEVFEQINEISFNSYTKVHFVGHSLGGLLCRAYLQEKQIENLGNVVLLGSPSHGTELVDVYNKEWWFEYAGPTAKILGTKGNSFPKSLKNPYYNLGVIAGVYKTNIEIIEKAFNGEHDGMVSVESTKIKGMSDFIKIFTSHSMMRHNNNVAIQTIEFLRSGRFLH